jgi:peptidoglycan-N-acetylglucosamine deacetylase
MMAKEILCAFGVHVDAVAGWLGSYGGEDSPADISRGLFAGEIGTMRLLDLFGRWGIKTSWFVPGHSMETFPEQMKRVAAAGHEFGVHGYSHENPIALTSDQEETILVKCIGLIEQLTGRKPRGYVAPWWELSPATAGMDSATTTACSITTSRRTMCRWVTAGTRSTIPSTRTPG